MTGDTALVAALAALGRALGRSGAPFMIIGGVAVIARGVRRLTDDVDATVWAPGLDLGELLAILAAEGITGRIPNVEQFAADNQVLLLVHGTTQTEIKVSLAWLPFEDEALRHSERLVLRSVEVPVARAEDLVIYKAVAWRDKDRADVAQLLRLHGRTIDLDRVRKTAAEFAEALEEPERLAQLERLLTSLDEP